MPRRKLVVKARGKQVLRRHGLRGEGEDAGVAGLCPVGYGEEIEEWPHQGVDGDIAAGKLAATGRTRRDCQNKLMPIRPGTSEIRLVSGKSCRN